MSKLQKIIGNRNRDSYRIIRWDITQQCNYTCNYCIKQLETRKPSVNWRIVVNWINNQLDNSYPPFIVQLFGGEPTIHPQFWFICNSIKVKFGLYTNLSQTLDFYEKLYSYNNFCYLICSFHLSQERDINTFYRKIEVLNSYKNVQTNIAVFLENTNLDKLEQVFIQLGKINKTGKVYFNTETTNNNYYNNIELSYFNKYMLPEQIIQCIYNNTYQVLTELDCTRLYYTDNKLFNLKGFSCDINRYGNYVIDYSGNIYNCVRSKPITSVFDNFNITKYSKVICRNIKCLPYLLQYGSKENIKL